MPRPILPPFVRTTHLKKGGIGAPFIGPLCGQRGMDGKAFARTLYTTDTSRVTCKKCQRAAFKAHQAESNPS